MEQQQPLFIFAAIILGIGIITIIGLQANPPSAGKAFDAQQISGDRELHIPPGARASCIDTDGGRIYGIFGYVSGRTITGRSYRYNDVCSGDVLTEQFCNGSYPSSEEHLCLFGCSNGKCNLPPHNETNQTRGNQSNFTG